MSSVSHYKEVGIAEGNSAVTTSYSNPYPVEVQQVLLHSACIIQLSTIAGGAASTVVRITSDLAGDECLVPDTTATISAGVTTATKGTTVYKTDIVVPSSTNIVYVWVKVDAGTAVLDKVTVTGVE